MSDGFLLPITTLITLLLLMVAEALHAARNEREQLARGAVEPAGDVYKTMRWAYPLCFVAMAVEGSIGGPASRAVLLTGLITFVLAKALKYWAIGTLGRRWTFRVLVLPAAPLIVRGPYAWLRHPNYVAVIGELAGAAALMAAPITGLLSLVGFGSLLWRRISIEDRALGRT